MKSKPQCSVFLTIGPPTYTLALLPQSSSCVGSLSSHCVLQSCHLAACCPSPSHPSTCNLFLPSTGYLALLSHSLLTPSLRSPSRSSASLRSPSLPSPSLPPLPSRLLRFHRLPSLLSPSLFLPSRLLTSRLFASCLLPSCHLTSCQPPTRLSLNLNLA